MCHGCGTDAGRTNERTLKIELLSQWKLEAEFRNINDERNRSDEVDCGRNTETSVEKPNAELDSQLHPEHLNPCIFREMKNMIKIEKSS